MFHWVLTVFSCKCNSLIIAFRDKVSLIALAIFRIYMIILGEQKKVNKWSYVDEKIAKNEDN